MVHEARMAEATGKVNSRNPVVSSPEESDGNIVPEKSANKGVATPAESMEGRTPAERNSGQEAAHRTQRRESASNGLDRVRQRAEADKTLRFNNLFHFLEVDVLRASFYELKRNAAPGLDGVTWHAYERTLEDRLPALERELHIGSFGKDILDKGSDSKLAVARKAEETDAESVDRAAFSQCPARHLRLGHYRIVPVFCVDGDNHPFSHLERPVSLHQQARTRDVDDLTEHLL